MDLLVPQQRKLFPTERNDRWWVAPLSTFIVFTGFIIYATWRTFENDFYQYQNYLSPFYSPKFIVNARLFGFKLSPALLIMPFPLIFRATCYYYRKAYYRAFFWDPPACAAGEPYTRRGYTGEARFPLVLQNIHRYTWYVILFFMAALWWDTLKAFIWQGGFHMGIGSLVFLLNIVLLSGYTFGCHAWRHFSGGCLNCYSCSRIQAKNDMVSGRKSHGSIKGTASGPGQVSFQWHLRISTCAAFVQDCLAK